MAGQAAVDVNTPWKAIDAATREVVRVAILAERTRLAKILRRHHLDAVAYAVENDEDEGKGSDEHPSE